MKIQQVGWILILFALGFRCGAFSFDDVCQKAAVLGAKPYVPYSNNVPESLTKMTYLQYQAIHFRKGKALWKNDALPFQVEFFHPGYLQRETVNIYEVAGGEPRLVPSGSALYDYGAASIDSAGDFGHAGFRIVSPENGFGEVAVFLGASYFRMIGERQSYGASARGLALGTGSQEGEEFPVFREFWIQKPGKRDISVEVYALMDSPSTAGACHFIITPGRDTVARVETVLYPRVALAQAGLAPLTSMFLYGKNGRPQFFDFRPEVHDSDGLLAHTGKGEWIWHPLEAGHMIRFNAFSDENPRGFGLLQRERRFENFEDTGAHFEQRPSVWVSPRGAWGKGAVILVQLPSDREFQDNIVAFWRPAEPLPPGGPLRFEYDLHWTRDSYFTGKLGYAAATRIGKVIVEPPKVPPNIRFVIDFAGPAVERLSNKESLAAEVEFSKNVKFVADSVFKSEIDQTWRLVIEIADPESAADLKACLKYHDKPITETWTFTWQP